MARQTSTPRRTTARVREARILELRMKGLTYEAIGDQLEVEGLGHMTDMGVMKAIRRVLERMAEKVKEDAETVREIELRRLDRMTEGLWEKASKGDGGAVDRILRIQEARRRYIEGLEVAKNVAHTGEIGVRHYVGVDVEAV